LNCQVRIVSELDTLLEENRIGQIQITGGNVTQQYFNNPKATKALFSNDGWLNTGDIGFLRDGELFITGRRKDIIFANGQNIYPHDLEQILINDGIVESGKIAFGGYFDESINRDRILAFILFRGKLLDFWALAEQCKRLVIDQTGIIIDTLLPTKRIPKTTSGKIQRFKLIQDYLNGEFSHIIEPSLTINKQSSISSPISETEAVIRDFLSLILGSKILSLDENFLMLGLNSLKAGELLNRISDYFSVDLSFGDVFNHQTIRLLAGFIDEMPKENRLPILPVKDTLTFKASSAQERLYYQWHRDKESIAYNVPTAFRIKGDLNLERWENSIKKVIECHEAFRTYFSLHPDGVTQNIKENIEFDLSVIDTSYEQLQIADYIQPFNLHQAPLFRFSLLNVCDKEYIFFTDFHHAIIDGISVVVFIEELLKQYYGALEPSNQIWQFKDFANFEIQNRRHTNYLNKEHSWKQIFSEQIPKLELRTDYPRSAFFNNAGAKLFFLIPSSVVKSIIEFTHKRGVTLQLFFLTAYKVLLSKYTGSKELVVGIPASGRNRSEFGRVIGMLVNNLAIKSTQSPNHSFSAYMNDIEKIYLSALDNQDYLFADLLDSLSVKSDQSRNALFDTMFNYIDFGISDQWASSKDISISHYPFDPRFSKYDLTLEVLESTDRFRFSIEYATSLFKEDSIYKLGEHYLQLIKNILINPDAPIKEISVLSEAETQMWLDFNATTQDFPEYKTVLSLFKEQVTIQPDKIAVISGDEAITYLELDTLSDRLASKLTSAGAGYEDKIAIVSKASEEFVVSALAIWKIGAAYVPIDMAYPDKRKQDIIEDCEAVLVLSHEMLLTDSLLSIAKCMNVSLDELRTGAIDGAIGNLVNKSDDLAYIIYTSGSTGRPKGVKVAHRSLTNYVWWSIKIYINNKDVTFPLYSSISFDLTITSLFTPLASGNTIRVYNDEGDPSIIEVIKNSLVDIVKLTPSHLRIINSLPDTYFENSKISSFIVGGENLDAELASSVTNKFRKSITIYNEYGPTEATVGCMIYEFKPKEDVEGYVPIGKPIDNSNIFLVDDNLKPVPINVPGEILIGGKVLSKGYLGNDELNSAKFIVESELSNDVLYKTGDLALMLPSGNIEYLGRKDNQVKINGYRIELDEIRSHIVGQEGVSDAVVVVNQRANGKNVIDAYYTGSQSLDSETIMQSLINNIPHFMIPGTMTRIDKISLNRNGKVDVDSLPLPVIYTRKMIEASDDIEALLVEVFKEVLALDELGVTEDFIAVGGDSIKAVQITSRLQEKGCLLKVNDILKNLTISRIKDYVTLSINTYSQLNVDGIKEFTPIDYWFFEKQFININHYNQSILLKFHKSIDKVLLEKSFNQIIKQHDGLRINYRQRTKEFFFNSKHLSSDFKIGFLEVPESFSNEFTNDSIKGTALWKGSFNLEKDLLIRAAILNDSTSDRLLITAHHLVIDGFSWRIFLEDLYIVYSSQLEGKSISLPKKTASVQLWSEALRSPEVIKKANTEKIYWNEVVKKGFTLPLDYHVYDWSLQHKSVNEVVFSVEESKALEEIAHQNYHTNISTLLLAAICEGLLQWTGKMNLEIELEGHGRELPSIDVSRTIGWFTTIFPVKLVLSEEKLSGKINSVKDQLSRVPNAGFNFVILKYLNKKLKDTGDISEVRFNYLGSFSEEVDNNLFSYVADDFGANVSPQNHFTTKLDINAFLVQHKLYLQIDYSSKAFSDLTIQNFKKSVTQFLYSIIKSEEAKEIQFSASDFETVNMDKGDIESLFG
jgi:amino acid adenylation domain-containing protein/non-ribosomal peptide synthase protein (TIGR01720 family)